MNKRIFWISAVIVIAFALSLSAFAQPGGGQRGPGGPGGPGGGPGGFGGMRGGGMMMGMGGLGMFVQNSEFTKMLEMTPEQVESVQKVYQDARAQMRPPQGQQGGPPNFEEMMQRMNELHGKALEVLKPEQQAKFKEIHFQVAGGLQNPMLHERMLEVLNLTAEQKDKLRQMVQERNAQAREIFQNRNWREMSDEERQKFGAEMEERVTQFSEKVKGILTAEQKEQAEKLSSGASELREKLNLGQPGVRQDRGGRRGGGGPAGDGYRPGAGSWRPGQGTPDSGAPPAAGAPGNRRFPRSDNQQ